MSGSSRASSMGWGLGLQAGVRMYVGLPSLGQVRLICTRKCAATQSISVWIGPAINYSHNYHQSCLVVLKHAL